MIVAADIAGELRAIVGDRHVLERPRELVVYESDGLPGYHKRPALAVFPGSRAEVVAVVQFLAQHRIPYVPRGAGTGLSGGALADGVVLLGLQRLKRIIAIDTEARTATVEPGVVNAWLSAAALPHGLHYAPDPSSQSACTIGGNVAENAGGPHCLKYGVTLNHVLSATVVLPSGEVVTLRIPESPADGYDLMGTFIGSEGCFGVALDVTVRLTPNPLSVRTLLADFTSVDDAAHATSAIVATGIVPAACELMDQGTILAVEASIYAAGYPQDAAAVLLVEVDGAPEAVADDGARVEQICREHGARSVRVAVDALDRARLWQGRKKAFGAMGRMAPNLAVQDAVVPRTRLAEILAGIASIATLHGIRVCNVFHAGDGNLHPNVPYDGRDPDEARRVHIAMKEIMTLCIEAGGTITGEHGVGLDKLGYMEDLFTPDTLDAMCRLRSAFDPDKRANPGKTIPVHSCREWTGFARTASSFAAETAETHNANTAARRQNDFSAVFRNTSVYSAANLIADQVRTSRSLYVGGAGTAVTAPEGVTRIDVRNCRDVIEYIPQDLTITVGAGMTIAELNAITVPNKQWCPLLPWGTDNATIGGVLASARRGPASTSLGAPRDLTLGMTYVDGRAAIVTPGGRVVKNVAGFDLTRAMIGSWGTLGAIISASLRLRALPAVQETWVAPLESVSREALRTFNRGPYAPVSCETISPEHAEQLGLTREKHVVIWIAGSSVHVEAARTTLSEFASVREISMSVWDQIRSAGAPSRGDNFAMTDSLADLNARVHRVFNPSGVFVSPVVIAREGAHV